jgi:glycosyltransferase involved in cell wall biosynthesis
MIFSADPERGSEPGVGWNRAVQAAKYCDTWVITCRDSSEAPVKKYIERHGPIPGLKFVFVGRTCLERWFVRLGPLKYLSYRLWQRRALSVARQLHEQVRFDLTHHVNYVGFREPGYVWKLPAPFVWGPIGGTQNYPWRFLWGAGWGTAIREFLRTAVNWFQLRFSTRVRRALRRATPLLAANATIRNDIKRANGPEAKIMLETGVKQVFTARAPEGGSHGELRIAWSGVLSARKALELLLEALARLPADVAWRLRVVGDGPLRRRWQRLAERRGLNGRVEWLGWLPHADAVRQFEWADVFAFTSLRDTTGTVLIEALAHGLPIICLDHQGAGQVVTPQCGMKMPVTDRKAAIDGFRKALLTLAEDRGRLAELSRGAYARACQFTWDSLGTRMAEVYEQVLKQNGKPYDLHANGRRTEGKVESPSSDSDPVFELVNCAR